MHEEVPQASVRLLGVQLWLSLPASQKMARPAYHAIDAIPEVRLEDGALVRVVAGEFRGAHGFAGDHLPATFLDVWLPAGTAVDVDVEPGHAAYAFLLEGATEVRGDEAEGTGRAALVQGGAAAGPADRANGRAADIGTAVGNLPVDSTVDGGTAGGSVPAGGARPSTRYAEKTALAFGAAGKTVGLAAPTYSAAHVIFFSAPRLDEPVAWGGPIVMNTQEELEQAFEELQTGPFIKERPALCHTT